MDNSEKKRCVLVTIVPQGVSNEAIFEEMKELKELVDSFGGQTIDFITQGRNTHSKGKYIGDGKIVELAEVIKNQKIDIVVLNGIIKPGHLYDLKRELSGANSKINVWDRSDLILEIFAKHANTAEAKLQIELAAMRHMGPRIYGMGVVLSGQGGGIGTRGIGETNTERMRRHWKVQMKKVREKLQKLSTQREQQLNRRKRVGLPTVSLVGYTNAGKTSIFNVLSGKEKYADSALFATLDTTTYKLYFKSDYHAILTDTIGFIQNLPPHLVDAFNSTLLESIHADLLLHVIDISDPAYRKKIDIVENTLQKLPVRDVKRVYVFNKVDAVSLDRKSIEVEFAEHSPLFVSAKSKEGIKELLKTVEVELANSI